ncbi:hypothetical protein ACPYOC_05630 [Ornithinimicrobium sp. W1665]|uniref:hypothetical protein n=2 Tax=Ornithinimicrobium sp. W1665 TaxID=3416666 RepID=UPI003CF1C091
MMVGIWRRRARRKPSSPDPVAASLAGITVPLRPRRSDTDVSWEDLPRWIEVSEAEDVDGFDTVVGLSDEIQLYCDPFDDGLDRALADQHGISKVVAEDRDLIYLRTRLALEDVRAAVVRAVAEIHHARRSPRPTGEVPDTVVEELAIQMAPLLQQSGFAPKPSSPRYFWRAGGDGFAQSVMLSAGGGYASDGTSCSGLVSVSGGTYVPELAHWKIATPEQMVPGYSCVSVQGWAPPDPGRIRDVLASVVLPAMDGTRDRRALAAWVADDPGRVGIPLTRCARALAQWGLLDEATRVVEHLETGWPSLAEAPDLLEAKTLIRRGRGG